ncbi:MAG: hypothetical protein AB8I08_23030 [Sandaracinaceae bacterium]
MLSVRCPQCGKPAPVDLSAPGSLRCDACHYLGEPDPEARERIQAAASLLGEMSANRRQLGTLAGRALGSGTIRTLLYLTLAAVLGLPLLLFAGFFILEASWLLALLASIPVLFLLVLSVIGFLALRRSFAKLARACAARPPSAPGEAAKCHVCGASLAASEGVVRCGFCRSDNLLGADATDRVEALHDEATADLSQAVRDRADAVAATWRRLSLLLVGGLFTGPLVMCVTTGCLVLAPQPELEPNQGEDATIVERDGARCLGQLAGGDRRLWFGGRAESGYWAAEPDIDPAAYTWFDPETLVGRRVRSVGPLPFEGRLDRIVGTLDGRNQAILVNDEGDEARRNIAGLCLLE